MIFATHSAPPMPAPVAHYLEQAGRFAMNLKSRLAVVIGSERMLGENPRARWWSI